MLGHPDWSVAGLVGFEAPEDKGPVLVKEAFRWILAGTSLSHEVRRAGFGMGAMVDVDVACMCSTSSSDDANASESGVERRTPG